MRKIHSLIALTLLLAACSGHEKVQTIEITNPSDLLRTDEPIVIGRERLHVREGLLPAVVDAEGNFIPSQADDIDGDGQWDELAFVLDLAPMQTREVNITWVEPADYPSFTIRTNVRYGVMTTPGHVEELTSDMHYKDEVYYINTEGYPYQMDGIGWENDLVGFRHYYDGRNCRDYFGKRVTDMVLDTVGIRPDGTPGDTYHVWADWGRDIMSVGTSFGIGGLGAWVDDSRFVRMGRVNADPVDVIDSTGFTLVFEGPVRSRFALDFYGWQIDDNKVNVRQEVSIWAGKYNYENKVIAKDLPENVSLITGIVHNFNDQPFEEIVMEKYLAMATHDMQSYDKEFWMGMGLVLPRANVEKLFDTAGLVDKETMSATWCAKLKLDGGEATYKAYSTWEHQDERFRDRKYFLDLMAEEVKKMEIPVEVTVK